MSQTNGVAVPTVISFTEYKFRDTIAVLRHLVRLATRGELTGVALCYGHQSEDEFAFTGEFKTHSAAALKAANRITWKMNHATDVLESLH